MLIQSLQNNNKKRNPAVYDQIHICVVNATVRYFAGIVKEWVISVFLLALFTYNSVIGRHNIFVIPWTWFLERVWVSPGTQYSFVLLILTLPNDLTGYLMINQDTEDLGFLYDECVYYKGKELAHNLLLPHSSEKCYGMWFLVTGDNLVLPCSGQECSADVNE